MLELKFKGNTRKGKHIHILNFRKAKLTLAKHIGNNLKFYNYTKHLSLICNNDKQAIHFNWVLDLRRFRFNY
jgi:hypothetical protein